MKKKEMILLTDEENKCYEEQKVCHVCKKEFSNDDHDDDDDGVVDDDDDNKKNQKVRDHCHCTRKYRGDAHNTCNLVYKTPKEIPTVFHNGSTYGYHFIINQLAKEFDGQLKCLRENTENILLLQYQLKKKHVNGKTIIYKLKLIDSCDLCQPNYQNLLIIYLKFTENMPRI